MKISIITPTYKRHTFLPLLLQLVRKQTHTHWEWLILDTSPSKSADFENIKDPRIQYLHHEKTLTLGEKRNLLIEEAKGEVIVHFDDDDYYAPFYLETVSKVLENTDFFNIYSWFNYDVRTRELFYWETKTPSAKHFILDPQTGMRSVDFTPFLKKENLTVQKQWEEGYGFSYAYRRTVWEKNPFQAVDFGEDFLFFKQAQAARFSSVLLADEQGSLIHLIHAGNMSRVLPQYHLPPFLLKKLFPDFCDYLKQFPC